MDADGYPDDAELERVKTWPHSDIPGLFEFVRERWQYADAGYWTQDGRTYRISTAGWSGNESLIGAMKQNLAFWAFCWQSSRRGGHYEFEVPQALAGA